MARRTEVVIHFTDDMDGGKAEGTIAFSFDGTDYEIDLSKRNRAAFEKVLAPYITSGRKVRAVRGRKPTKTAGSGRTDLAKVRTWAKANGYEVSDRGRISAAVIEAFDCK